MDTLVRCGCFTTSTHLPFPYPTIPSISRPRQPHSYSASNRPVSLLRTSTLPDDDVLHAFFRERQLNGDFEMSSHAPYMSIIAVAFGVALFKAFGA